MKTCLTSLIIKKMKIKTMRYHFAPVQTSSIKKTTSVGKDVEREPLFTVDGNVNWYSHYEKQHEGASKNEKQNHHMIQQSHFQVYIQRK